MRRSRFITEGGGGLFVPFSDICMLLFMVAITLVLILVAFISKPNPPSEPKEHALYVDAEWDACLPAKTNGRLKPGEATSDLDLYVAIQGSKNGLEVVSFKQLKSEILVLNQDDLGGPNGKDDVDLEIVTSNVSVLPADVLVMVNLHAYSLKSDRIPVCARIRVIVDKDRPYQNIVFDEIVEFTSNGMEISAVRFRTNKAGGVLDGSVSKDKAFPLATQRAVPSGLLTPTLSKDIPLKTSTTDTPQPTPTSSGDDSYGY